MSEKAFRPEIVDYDARNLADAYGFTPHRKNVLLTGVATLIVAAGHTTPWWKVLDQLANIAATPAEFAYMIVITTAYASENNIPNI